jgi:predicted phage tail protein
LSGQPDGDYTFRVRATDAVGNTGPVASSTYRLDTTGPTVSITPPNSPGSGRTPTWTFSTEAGASAECQLSSGAGVLQPYAPCSSPVSYSLAGQPDGDYTVAIRATDVAGNRGPVASSTYVLDTSGPATTIVSGPTSPGNETAPSWSFTSEPGAATECQLARGATVLQAFASCDSPKGYSVTGEPDGAYTFSVRGTDAAGNAGATVTGTYTLDTTAPPVPAITSAPASPGNDPTVAWSFVVEAGATAECELTRGATVVEPFSPCSGSSSHDLAGRPDGDYAFRVRAVDDLGNRSNPATSSYTLDTTPPQVTITSAPATPGTSRNPTWSFTTEGGAATECSLTSGATTIAGYGACVSPVSFDLNGQPDGSYTLHVRATDAVGNAGPDATSAYALNTVPPGNGGGGGDRDEGGKDEGGKDDSGNGGDSDSGVPDDVPETIDPGTEVPTETAAPVTSPDDSTAGGSSRREHDKDGGKRQQAGEADRAEEMAPLTPTPDEARELAEASASRPSVLGEILDDVSAVVSGLLEQPGFPLGLIALVGAFLMLQNRIDRRDPKLALAPVYPDPHLYFEAQEGPGKDR